MEKKQVKLNKDYCKSCGMCIKVCPFGVLAFSDEFNKSGYHPVKQVFKCKGCGLCYLICPDFAIEVVDND